MTSTDIWQEVNALGGYLPPTASDYDRGYSAAVDAALELIERSAYEKVRAENDALREILARILDDGETRADRWTPTEAALDLARAALSPDQSNKHNEA